EGRPKERYFRFLDQTQSAAVLAEGIREAYADLFQINTKAQTLSKTDVVNKFKTLSQGQISESVLDKMAMTFAALAKLADFDAKGNEPVSSSDETAPKSNAEGEPPIVSPRINSASLGGL